ncbi:HlyD family efflux transporter periplasmic adaptor subunit [Pseudoalteromonas luteoviolacea]|nr:HlyD family efflux transporter periplasmic adaptor subunit [Pseudoalteromonas luteoviolacea]MBQ4813848.1 HlyD family efflux transporter periplasmic adaptor subunit [Pseudoalteromonas luteoviolacea]
MAFSNGDFAIARESLTVGEVKKGRYVVLVRGAGELVPDNIKWLSAEVDAVVEEVVLKAGSKVQKGDVIVKLSNHQLQQSMEEQKWELEALRAEYHADNVDYETRLLQQEVRVSTTKLDHEHSVAEFAANEDLISYKAVSQLDFERARSDVARTKQLWESSQKELANMRRNFTAQKKARAARLKKDQKNLERLEQQVANLVVRATMNGIIQEVPLEAGQRISMGTNIAKLAQHDSLIAELQVPELQIRNISIGQEVSIDTRNSVIRGKVQRIDPAVVNGNVQVDVVFTEALPDDARPELSVDGEIKVAEIDDTLYVERPLFIQSNTRSSIYKLSQDKSHASRLDIKTGYGSISSIQILEGLKEGDSIIISDPTRFESFDSFRVN